MRAVKRFSKAILLALGGLLALTIGVLLTANFYLKSASAQAQIQEAVGDALGFPITIESTSLTLWSDLKIHGFRAPQPDGTPGDFLAAQNFSASYRLLPLFGKKLVIPHVTLDAPKIAWRTNADGQWEWPNVHKKPKSDQPKVKKPKEKKPKKTQLVGRAKSGFEVLIEDVVVRGGTIDLLDENGVPVTSASGVDIDLDEFAPPDFDGKLRAQKIVWTGLVYEQVASPFSFDDGVLDFPAITAQLAGGTVQGAFQLDTDGRGSPFTATLNVGRAELGKLAGVWGWTEGDVAGQLSGEFALHGTMKKFARSEGTGHLRLEGGHFQQLGLFETVGQVLGIEELTNLRFNEAGAELRMAEEKILVEPLTLATPELRITAKGSVKLDTKLSLDARLAVSDALAKRLPGFVRDNFTATDTDPMRGIDFKVSGKIDKPKTDIVEKIMGKKVGDQLGDLIGGLFGTKKKKGDDDPPPPKEPREKKKKDKEKPPEPDPAKPADAPTSTIQPAAPDAAKEPAPQP